MLSKIRNITRLLHSIKWVKGKLELHRAINSDTPFLPNLGIHWTTDYKKAYPYGGKLKSHYDPYLIYTAIVPVWAVNWIETFKAAIGPFPLEKEVVLKRNKTIRVILVVRRVNLEPFKIVDEPGRFPDDPETTYKWHFPKEVTEVYNQFYTKT